MNINKDIYGLICIVIMYMACDSPIGHPLEKKSVMEGLIMNNWQFVSIEVNGQRITRVSRGFDPNSGGGWIPWFWFELLKKIEIPR